MMTCNDDLIQLYVDGDLQPAEAAIVEAHLAECGACRRRAGLYKSLYWDLAHTERLAPAPAEGDAESLAALLQAEWQRGHAAPERRPAERATLWLTANPVVAGPARAVGEAGRAVGSVGRAGLASLGRSLTARLLGRRGGGGR